MKIKNQPWITPKAFIVAAALTAIGMYGGAAESGFSFEGISTWIFGTIVGGLVWGAVLTFALRRFF